MSSRLNEVVQLKIRCRKNDNSLKILQTNIDLKLLQTHLFG